MKRMVELGLIKLDGSGRWKIYEIYSFVEILTKQRVLSVSEHP